MTCIVGMIHKEKVYIGADSASVGNMKITPVKNKKVFKNGEFIMGCTSSWRMIDLLNYSLVIPKYYPEEKSVDAFMRVDFINAVRTCFKDGGFETTHDGETKGGVFLVGFRGRLFRIDSDYHVAESCYDYDAVGCGEEYALGSIYNDFNRGDSKPKEILLNALKASATFSSGVMEPFEVVS